MNKKESLKRTRDGNSYKSKNRRPIQGLARDTALLTISKCVLVRSVLHLLDTSEFEKSVSDIWSKCEATFRKSANFVSGQCMLKVTKCLTAAGGDHE